jgi:hypothetical protein
MEKFLSRNVVILFHLCLIALEPRAVVGKVFVYPSQNSVSPCISVDVTFNISLNAFNKTGDVASREITQDDVVSVSGSCAPAVITLSFTNKTNWSFQFNQDSNGDVHWQRVVNYVPSDVFRSSVDDTDVVSVKEGNSTNLFQPPFYYQCDKPEVLQYISKSNSPGLRYRLQVNLLKIQIQGNDLHSENINKPIHFASDNNRNVPLSLKMAPAPFHNQTNFAITDNETTVTSETTSTSQTLNTTSAASPATATSVETATTPQPQTYVNTYIVSENNMNCILLQGAMTISIDYLHNESTTEAPTTRTVTVNVPANATGTGNCNYTDNSQSLVISFFDDWSLDIIFTLTEGKIPTTQVSGVLNYKITNLTLSYVTNSTLFPGSEIPPDTKITVSPQSSKDTDYPRKSGGSDYYKCSTNIKMNIESGVTVQTTELQFKAFNTNNETTFSGQADECAADEETNQTVPIAVAATLGGLTLVIAVFYAISKIRNKG